MRKKVMLSVLLCAGIYVAADVVKIGVLDFALESKDLVAKALDLGIKVPEDSKTTGEVAAVNLAYVKLFDDWSSGMEDTLTNRAKSLAIYKTMAKSSSAFTVGGAAALTEALNAKSFSKVSAPNTLAALQKVAGEKDFPKNFMLKLSREAGINYLVYGTIANLRSTGGGLLSGANADKEFYLDLSIKVLDLGKKQLVFSGTYAGSAKGASFSKSVFDAAMNSAVRSAAKALNGAVKSGKLNATALPGNVTITPSGGMLFVPAIAEIYIDGVQLGRGGETFLLSGGEHTLLVKAKGYRDYQQQITISGDSSLSPQLKK